jgi:glycosyltransferase involved in cell wall biosynthesis
MPLLFAAAGALVFPSLFEGGGIPVLEAIACGCPVAASDLPSLREYADDTIRYFNPESSAEIAGEMTSLHKNEHLRAESVRRGLSRCEDFRAKVVACTMIEIYRKLGQ